MSTERAKDKVAKAINKFAEPRSVRGVYIQVQEAALAYADTRDILYREWLAIRRTCGPGSAEDLRLRTQLELNYRDIVNKMKLMDRVIFFISFVLQFFQTSGTCCIKLFLHPAKCRKILHKILHAQNSAA